jgi:hypothetical protein
VEQSEVPVSPLDHPLEDFLVNVVAVILEEFLLVLLLPLEGNVYCLKDGSMSYRS